MAAAPYTFLEFWYFLNRSGRACSATPMARHRAFGRCCIKVGSHKQNMSLGHVTSVPGVKLTPRLFANSFVHALWMLTGIRAQLSLSGVKSCHRSQLWSEGVEECHFRG